MKTTTTKAKTTKTEDRRREARAAAEQIGGTRAYVAKNTETILAVLTIFGGRVLAVVTE